MELLSYHGMVEFRKGPVTGQGENRKGIITKYFASASIGKYGCYPILTCRLDLSSNLSHHYAVMKIYLFNFLIFHCIPGEWVASVWSGRRQRRSMYDESAGQ